MAFNEKIKSHGAVSLTGPTMSETCDTVVPDAAPR